jgi:hypothetical protein
VGSGANIILNTALGGSSSPTDRIVVNGGSATGQTVLTIRNAGGVGGLTTGAGIPIVITTNGGTTASDAFALSSTPVLNGFRYTLVDPGGDWYLVSSPTTTQAQVQNSVNAVAKAQQDQIVTNRVLGSILLGATEQISCSSCGSGFGSIGSLGLGAHGRWGLSDQLTAMGGFSYNQWSSNGISVYDALSSPARSFMTSRTWETAGRSSKQAAGSHPTNRTSTPATIRTATGPPSEQRRPSIALFPCSPGSAGSRDSARPMKPRSMGISAEAGCKRAAIRRR